MWPRRIVLPCSLVLVGCSDDVVEILPACDEVSWPLGIEPVITPPTPEFQVECAEGWGNDVETRPALDTVPATAAGWTSLPHPAGGWVHVIFRDFYTAWNQWLEAEGVDPASLPEQHALVWTEQDGSLGWTIPEYQFWSIAFVGDELWALAWDADDSRWLLAIDPGSGAVVDAREWDLGPRYNWLAAAPDAAGGAWITALEDREEDDRVDQSLYRANTIDTIELVAMRTTDAPRSAPSGYIEGLPDGAAAWGTGQGFEVIEPDGTVRWTHASGWSTASDADAMLIVSLVPTGFGEGLSLRLEKVALADGALLWTREHRRYVLSEPEQCGPDDCALLDLAYPVLRPDGGYLLLGGHAYPSSTCIWQPLVMAIAPDGDAEWVHRVETCGRVFRAAFREQARVELYGLTGPVDELGWTGAWTRSLEL
jgi:hypothetical protein